ncbi:MAG TPA: PEP-CTERM sorting domain-containing protein [Tepidisphaeraceae bacterium]|nr:PEP-CTERM sorting domain-containing protein [Tepidisphaeraceae bacterium]
MKRLIGAAAVSAVTGLASPALAQVNVFVQFGGAYESELDFATSLVSQPAFTPSQKEQLKEITILELRRIYAGYDVNFSLNDPGGTRHLIDFSLVDPGNGFGPYGSTNVNAVGGYVTSATAKMLPRNFGLLLQDLGLPANRTTILGNQFGQVAAHELGHIFGLNHQHIYADPGITPANYLDTGDLQRQHIMSVPSLPYTAVKTFNPFERALLDVVGGTALGGTPVVASPITEAVEFGDAGATPATAAALLFSQGKSFDQRVAMQRGDLDGSGADVDVYAFGATSAGALTVNLFSARSFYGEAGLSFNARLRLIGPDGVTVLADFDDLYYQGSVYDQATYVDFGGFTINVPRSLTDPFMVNVPISTPGLYYLEVSPVGGDAFAGATYQMLATYSGTTTVPEPAAIAGLALTALATLARRGRTTASKC